MRLHVFTLSIFVCVIHVVYMRCTMIISCSLWYILSLSFTCNFPWCGRFTVLCMSYTGGAAEELGAEEEESGGHIRPQHSASDRHDPSRFGEKHRGSPSGQPESSRSPAASRHLHWRHRSWCGRQIQHAKLYICVCVWLADAACRAVYLCKCQGRQLWAILKRWYYSLHVEGIVIAGKILG